MAYVGIKVLRLFTNSANPKIQGMFAGVMFRPISYNTLLGLEAQYPYGPYCTLNYGRNPIFTQVTGVPFRLMIKPGTIKMMDRMEPAGAACPSIIYRPIIMT